MNVTEALKTWCRLQTRTDTPPVNYRGIKVELVVWANQPWKAAASALEKVESLLEPWQQCFDRVCRGSCVIHGASGSAPASLWLNIFAYNDGTKFVGFKSKKAKTKLKNSPCFSSDILPTTDSSSYITGYLLFSCFSMCDYMKFTTFFFLSILKI